ncbi:hydrogenase expression/formation protein HypE [Candidatus Woesearchaeota archaeon]|nr:hydrogenase expression/formation protein HypE [Candidatus Woesearchaeota archaeon]
MDDIITLAHGSGGKEMQELINSFNFFKSSWKNTFNDSATYDIGKGKQLVFTTDSFTVDPVFFPGGNIGHLAFCGTVNDLCVMGALPLGLSLSLVIEEGFLKKELDKIINSIKKLSKEYSIPIATGDTKVMGKGKIDKIVINTSGVGVIDKKDLLTKKVEIGDKIILSGGLGEHAVSLLSKRFDYETDIVTDSKPLVKEIIDVKQLIKTAKDATRGGISAVLNDISAKNRVGMIIYEEDIPAKNQVVKITEMLGINLYELACEGRFVCIADEKTAGEVVKKLKKFNNSAAIIGKVVSGDKVIVQTYLGKRILNVPTGRIVPRIC